MKFIWTTIYVKNLEESISFYSNILGLRVLRRFPAEPGIEIAFMGNGTDSETLVELIADSSMIDIDHGELMVIGFEVDSADAMMDTVISKNISVYNGPFETPGSKYFTIKDPSGVSVQFFQLK